MNWIYIFPEAIHTEDAISLNLEGNRLTFFCNSQRVFMDLSVLRSGSSTVILKNPITGTLYPLFNFREILQIMDLGPRNCSGHSSSTPMCRSINPGRIPLLKCSCPGAKGN